MLTKEIFDSFCATLHVCLKHPNEDSFIELDVLDLWILVASLLKEDIYRSQFFE